MIDDQSLWERGAMVYARGPAGELLPAPGVPIALSESPPAEGPAPALGQHVAEVLGGRLGVSSAELDRLRGVGVV
jgi:crotonobetainyl-CoA:carnitine CoA-transferase CaiB-like acyl-CoA transferase